MLHVQIRQKLFVHGIDCLNHVDKIMTDIFEFLFEKNNFDWNIQNGEFNEQKILMNVISKVNVPFIYRIYSYVHVAIWHKVFMPVKIKKGNIRFVLDYMHPQKECRIIDNNINHNDFIASKMLGVMEVKSVLFPNLLESFPEISVLAGRFMNDTYK